MRYARNCDEITVYSFYKVLEKRDYRYIVINWDEYEELEDFDESKARELWREIYNEYCKLSEDNQTLMFFDLSCELVYLENRLFVGEQLIERLEKRKDIPEAIMMYCDALNKWKYRINPENDIDIEIGKVKKVIKVSENKIRLKKDELEKLTENEDEEPMSLSRQLLKMSIALNKQKIDARETSMLEFIEMIKEINEINQIRSKNGSKLSGIDY